MSYFHFHAPAGNFDEKLKSEQCAYNHNGRRCRNRVVFGLPLCHVHRRIQYNIKTGPSGIQGAGTGVFADDPNKQPGEVVFSEGDLVAPYAGQIISQQELDRRYADKTAPYAIHIRRGTAEDAAVERGIGSLLNHTPRAQQNAKLIVNPQTGRALVRATKNIRDGQEMFVNYGPAYRFNEPGVETSTNRKKLRV